MQRLAAAGSMQVRVQHLHRQQMTTARPQQGQQRPRRGPCCSSSAPTSFPGRPADNNMPRDSQHPRPVPISPLPGAHHPLKYAQMGHSAYGRGAPHLCYMQTGSQGIFYSKAHQQQQQQQQQAPVPAWGRLAAHITHTAGGLLHSGGSGSSGGSRSGPATAAMAGAGSGAAAAHDRQPGTQSDSSSRASLEVVRPQWHVLVLQALMVAAALLAGGLVLKHFGRSVAAALLACYSGLPFKA